MPGAACGWTWSWPGRACWPTASGGGPSWVTQPSRRTTARSISGFQRTQFVEDQQHRRALGDLLAQGGGQDLLAGQVDARHRLVHDQQLGFAGEGAGDEDALVLAAGEGVHRVLGAVRHADQLQGAPDRLAVGPAQDAEAGAGEPARGHDLRHGRRDTARRGRALRYVPDAPPVAEAAARGAEQLDLAVAHRYLPDHRADGGGLAGAVGAEQRDDLTAVDGEVDAAQDRARAQFGADATQRDDGLGHACCLRMVDEVMWLPGLSGGPSGWLPAPRSSPCRATSR